MSATRVRVVFGVALALLLVGTVVGAWVRALRPGDRLTDPSGNVERVEWVGTLAPDGTLAVRADLRLLPGADQELRGGIQLNLELPYRAVRLRVGGKPVSVPAPGSTGGLPPDHHLTIAYEVPGAARRTDEGVLLDAQVVPMFAQFSDEYGYAEVRATLVVDSGAAVEGASWRLPGAKVVRASHDGPVLGLAGAASTYDPVHLVTLLPSAAAPDAPRPDPPPSEDAAAGDGESGGAGGPATLEPGSLTDTAIRRARALAGGDFDGVADALSEGRVPDGKPIPQGPIPLVVAILVTAELAGLAAWTAWRFRRARRRAARNAAEGFGAAEPGTPSQDPPKDIAPDVVAMLVAGDGTTVATREAVAADLLRMIDRGAVHIQSLDSRRFILEVPPGDIGVNAAERAIVRALRPQGQSGIASKLIGPPLWSGGHQSFLNVVESDVRRRARRAGYLARALRLEVFLPLTLLLPFTALMGGDDDRVTAVALPAMFGALALAVVVSLASPLSLTSRGEDVRRRARAFARTVADTDAAADLGAPAVLVRGPYLVYATATGVAPRAARDIGTGRTMVTSAFVNQGSPK